MALLAMLGLGGESDDSAPETESEEDKYIRELCGKLPDPWPEGGTTFYAASELTGDMLSEDQILDLEEGELVLIMARPSAVRTRFYAVPYRVRWIEDDGLLELQFASECVPLTSGQVAAFSELTSRSQPHDFQGVIFRPGSTVPDVPPDDKDDTDPPAPDPAPEDREWGDFEDAEQVQRALIHLGFNVGSTGADGVWGSKSKSALRNFIIVGNKIIGTALAVTGTPNDQNMELLKQALVRKAGPGWPTKGQIANILNPTKGGKFPKYSGGFSQGVATDTSAAAGWVISKPGPNWQWSLDMEIREPGETPKRRQVATAAPSKAAAVSQVVQQAVSWFTANGWEISASDLQQRVCKSGAC